MKGDDGVHDDDDNISTSHDSIDDPSNDPVLMDRLAAYGDVLREDLQTAETTRAFALDATPPADARVPDAPAEIIPLRPSTTTDRRFPLWTQAAAAVALLVVVGAVFAAVGPRSQQVALEVPSTQTPEAETGVDEQLAPQTANAAIVEDGADAEAATPIADAAAVTTEVTTAAEDGDIAIEEPEVDQLDDPNLVPVFEVPSMPGVFICPPGSTGNPVEGGFCTRVSSLGGVPLTGAESPTPAGPTATVDPTGETVPVLITQRPDILSCPDGSTGTPVAGGTCTRVETRPVTITEVITFSCPPNSTENEENLCVADSTESESVAIIATTTRDYTCPEGTFGEPVEGGTCRRTETTTEIAPPIVMRQPDGYEEIFCPDGYGFDQNGECAGQVAVISDVNVIVTETISYSCPEGFKGTAVATGTCLRAVPGDIVGLVGSPPVLNYSCPLNFSGNETEGGTCTREEQVPVISTPQEPLVSCPAGYVGVAVPGGSCRRP